MPELEPVEVRLKGSGEWFVVERYTVYGSGWLMWQRDDFRPGFEGGDCGLARPEHWRFAEPQLIVGFMCGQFGCVPLQDSRWCPRVR